MKNALILHGTGANPHSNWFDWIKEKLMLNDYKVWVPQLPDADHPDMDKYKKFIFESEWEFTEDSIIIGHSSGAVAALSILEHLPKNKQIDTAIMVGVYRPENSNYSVGGEIDIKKVKNKAKKIIFIHSDNDPYCSTEHAEYYADKLQAELIVLPGNDHFSVSVNPKHTKLPKLIDVLNLSA